MRVRQHETSLFLINALMNRELRYSKPSATIVLSSPKMICVLGVNRVFNSLIRKFGKYECLEFQENGMRSPKLLPLALLALNEEGQIEGITRFQKLVFMAQMEIDDLQTRKYEFDSYKYGPFSKELYDDLDRLARNGYINRSVEKTGNENEKHIYSITEKGSDYIFQILERDSTQDDLAVEDLRQLKEEYNDMPILQLIRLIYNQHPEYAKDSKLDV